MLGEQKMDRPYYLFWRNKFLTVEAQSIDDMIRGLEQAAAELREMRDAGVVLEGGAEDDYARLVTSNPAIAEKYGFEDWDDFE
jgi:hypothetical protein